MFADNTKLHKAVENKSYCDQLQNDLNALSLWFRTWILDFNRAKCAVLRIHSAISYFCFIQGVYLNEVTEQRDLGVIVSND